MLIFAMIALLQGCDTFFEPDITDQNVNLVSPAKGISTDVAAQTFLWEKIRDNSDYHFQLASPSFDSSATFIVDTVIPSLKFDVTLYPARFEWRVRAENSVYHTNWTTSTFSVFSTTDLTRQKVNLLAPGSISNTGNLKFQWDKLYNAEKYSFVVYRDNWDGIIVVPPLEVSLNQSDQALKDGKYVWGVMALNQNSQSIYWRKDLIVDSTPPLQPVLITPRDSSVITAATISFSWNSSDLTSGISQDTSKNPHPEEGALC